jgi:hypothetical protein
MRVDQTWRPQYTVMGRPLRHGDSLPLPEHRFVASWSGFSIVMIIK